MDECTEMKRRGEDKTIKNSVEAEKNKNRSNGE
jgi:hypothetical protein